ncbi:galacturonosyltransferase 7 [Spatholobus suberectus]|nr:galacturonosyltransferase 7 [Spatholobus suberectus]
MREKVRCGGRKRMSHVAAPFHNVDKCAPNWSTIFEKPSVYDPSLVHMANTLNVEYLCSLIVIVHSQCLENIFFHFLILELDLKSLVKSTFPQLKIKVYYFNLEIVFNLFSISMRQALE